MNEPPAKAPGRNDPCWCGSAKKYKKCHGAAGGVSDAGSAGGFAGAFKRKRPSAPVLDAEERDRMRAAARFNAELMDFIRPQVIPGISTEEIDRRVDTYTRDHGHTPACFQYRGFPKSCCTSINEVVCHGIPDERVLEDGDIINVDLTSIVDGWHGDQSETILVGEVTDKARRLTQVTFECMHRGIDAIKPGGSIRDIGAAIVQLAHARGYSVVREYQGHGIGRKFHQDPDVPHFPDERIHFDTVLPGTCFTIEPMINVGTWRTVLDRRDGWTVRTSDGELSAQFEHTILMTEDGPEILTLTQHGPQKGHEF